MKNLLAFSLATLAISSSFADELEVELMSGFHATAYPAIETGPEAQVYGYGVRGGTLLLAKDGSRIRLSADCTGFDRAMEGKTVGAGHCVWADADADRLYVTLETGHEGNVYSIVGGTGKWTKATGTIKTRFTYLPSPEQNLYLGVEEGEGVINTNTP